MNGRQIENSARMSTRQIENGGQLNSGRMKSGRMKSGVEKAPHRALLKALGLNEIQNKEVDWFETDWC